LYTPPENECMRLYGLYELPSPEALKWKIIIKDRKIGNDDDSSPCIFLEDEEEDSAYGSFREWSDSITNSISIDGSLQNIRKSPEASNPERSVWVDSRSESSEVDAHSDYLANNDSNNSIKYLNQRLIGNRGADPFVTEEKIYQIKEATGEETSSKLFVEEGTRTPIQMMSLRLSIDELKDNNFLTTKYYLNEKVKELQRDEESSSTYLIGITNLEHQESLTRSIESISTFDDYDRLLNRSISTAPTSVRESKKSRKKSSVTSLGESENAVKINKKTLHKIK